MDVAVFGGRGFVGEAVTRAIGQEHSVTTVDPAQGGPAHTTADILDDAAVHEAVAGADAVVNLVGLSPLQEPRGVTYEALHVDGAEHVVAACEAHDVDRLVHMSALGADPTADMAFLRTKGEGEQVVLDADLPVSIVRPSLIFDHGNELVETAKRLAPLRMFPRIPTRVQPIYRGDIAELFAMAVDGELDTSIVSVGGPDAMTIYTLVKKIFRWNGCRCLPLPVTGAMRLGLQVADVVPFMPVGADQARFLRFDNTVDENDAERYLPVLTGVDDWLADS